MSTAVSRLPIRLQIAVGCRLQAEVIVEQHMADRTWAHYTQAKWRAGLPPGGAVECRADLPRTWNVPVGSCLRLHGQPFEERADTKGSQR